MGRVPRLLRRLPTLVGAVVLVGYPVAAYFALVSFSPRVAAGVLLALLAPSAIVRLRRFNRAAMRSLAVVPIVAASLLLLAVVIGSSKSAMLLPTAINATLLATFAGTLVKGPPMIERFARLVVDDLSDAELRWCRAWTWIWVGFFAVNGSVALGLTLWASLEAWTAYNGVIGYIAMGMLFGIEYTVRKYRFGRLGDHLLDRALHRAFRFVRRETP